MRPVNRKAFYDNVRYHLFGGRLKGSQVAGMDAILNEWDQRTANKYMMPSWLAYMLATTYHETAHTMQPIEEYGKGRGKAYGKPHAETSLIYYGRGFVQLTWYENYLRAQQKLNEPLLMKPELALRLDIATQILFDGMIEGWFTGKKLEDYFNESRVDYISARRIINGHDRAERIAEFAFYFREAIS